ncbi:hypothetical protein SAMN04488595_11739 [Ralstonia sp. 25mfcol4.1]|uniref:BON domain-containing protein n=1 Tax=Burkholderiaceae TaxID=119060 RepID=UPI0008918131|nr:BON domain-containing protein [Ralstonia sp. 25mfcol4.1]SDP70393.1 hypothetical protein SAMN04488595_11739 [Ralstonia sp. 25mfcol4.1]
MSDTTPEGVQPENPSTPETSAPLTNHRYGGHSGVSDDHRKYQYEQAMPAHLDNSPTPRYSPCGTTEPAGIEQHGMYGTAPRQAALTPTRPESTRPLPGPASLGQYDNADMQAIAPLTDIQLREVLDERLAQWVDPGTVKATISDGICVLTGHVHDAQTKVRIGHVAQECLPSHEIRNQLELVVTG